MESVLQEHAAVQPQNLDAEESVLGAMMLAPGAIAAVREVLGPDGGDFYRSSHGVIYRAALALYGRGEPVDAITLVDELERRGELAEIGGKVRVHELAALVPAAANAGHYARIVRGKARERALLAELGPIVDAARSGGVDLADALAAIDRSKTILAEVESPGRGTLEPLDLAALLGGDPPATRWQWSGWLVQGDLVLVVGDPGVGKSLFALGLCDAVRRGAPFLGDPTSAGRVGILDFENPLAEVHQRLRQIGLTAEEHAGLLYVHLPEFDLAAPAAFAGLARLIDGERLALLVIDSLRRAAPGLDENDSASVSSVLTPLRALSARTEATILVVHHPRKRSGDNPTEAGQMVRGSLDLVASPDSLLYLRSKEGGAFTLEHAKSRRGVAHEPILVRIDGDDDRVELVNEGPVAAADDKVEAMLARVVEALRADGGPLERPVLAMRVDVQGNNGTFSRALKLGWQRGLLAKNDPKKVGGRTEYALAAEVRA